VRNEFALNAQPQNQQRRFERILLFIFIFTLPLLNPWIRGDGVGYYAYARAPLIQHNLDFTRDYQFANESFREGRFDENGNVRVQFFTPTRHLDNHFAVGPAMLWSPFLILTHAGVLIAHHFGSTVPADGFSAPYRYAMAFATAFYGFLALWLSFRLARKYVSPIWAFLATLAIWWASSLPVYMYFNPSWSHAHSAFICALFLWYWDSTREHRTLVQWLFLGVIAGIMLDVYYANFMLLVVLLVEALPQYAHALRSGATASLSFFQLHMRHALFAISILVLMLPTFISRTIVYGGPFESGYTPLTLYLWRSPVFLSVLFSSNHGLFYWTPLLAFAILGLIFFAVRLPKIGLPIVASLLAFYLFICFYPYWAGISSFGNRFFISLTVVFILGLAWLLELIATRFARPHTAVAVSSTALACFVLWNLGLIYQWGIHLVPARGPVSFRTVAYNQFFVVPDHFSSTIRSYFFRRSDLMEQIEHKDMEQLNDSAQP
jgi:hypothetical protein